MSSGHKAALARGRAESATVRHYLEALETSKPKRGRKRTPASIDRRLAAIESQLAGADALTRLHLLQEQKDLLDERSRVDQVKDLTALEKQFIKVAKAYGERKGITYSTWRAAGVSAAVLQKAEISPGPDLSGGAAQVEGLAALAWWAGSGAGPKYCSTAWASPPAMTS